MFLCSGMDALCEVMRFMEAPYDTMYFSVACRVLTEVVGATSSEFSVL